MPVENLFDQVKNEKKWSSHLDEDTNKIYFYNRVTKESTFSKPTDYDGDYIIGQKGKSSVETYSTMHFTKRFCTPMDLPPSHTASDTLNGVEGTDPNNGAGAGVIG